MSPRVLVADIGGTHARLALVVPDPGGPRFLASRTVDSREAEGVVPLIRSFLDDLEVRPERASLAIAGPVAENPVRLTNLGWEVDIERIGPAIGVEPTRVLNDFDAIGHAVPRLGPEDVLSVQEGDPVPGEPIAVLGAGTGLGVSLLHDPGDGYRVIGSEGGHVDFAPRTRTQAALLDFLRDRHRDVSRGHVSVERVLSGPGLVAIYDFLTSSGRAAEDPDTRDAMADGDAPAAISERAESGDDPAAVAALDLFMDVYGATAANLALLVQARGGVYMAGGIAQHNVRALTDGRFEAAFVDKGRFSEFLAKIPVRLIVREDVGLLGAAHAAMEGA